MSGFGSFSRVVLALGIFGVLGVFGGESVARIGENEYIDLHEALTAAKTAGTTCELLCDVDLTGKTWTPIADFKGIFDGKGFKITGLTVTGTGDLGLFGSTSGATIKNLTIDGATIGTVADTTGSNVGVLVGVAGTSTITGVTIKNATIASNAKYVGVIAGNSSSTITSCQVLGTADAAVTVKGKDQVGGISGYQWCNGVNNCTVSYCAVTALEERAGCLTGKLQCSSGNDSYFSVNGNTITKSSATAPDYAGGLVGQIHGDTDKYEIKNNKIDAVLTAGETNPIGVLRPFDQGAITTTFTAALAANVTGNWWENRTLAANSFQYTNVGEGVEAQTITRSHKVAQIGETKYETLADALAAATAGQTVEILVADTYTLPSSLPNITIEGKVDGVVINAEGSGSICSVPNGATFKNLTFNFGQNNYHGFQHAGTINMTNCTLNGKLFSYGVMNFTDCTFNQTEKDYCMWCYGTDVTYTGCTFNTLGKVFNVYCEGNTTVYNVTVDGCTFKNTGDVLKPAVLIKSLCGTTELKYNVVITGENTLEGNWPSATSIYEDGGLGNNGLWDVEGTGSAITVKQGATAATATTVWPLIAQIGETKYATLAAAISAVQDNETITLLSGVNEKTEIAAGTFNINLGAYTKDGNLSVGFETTSSANAAVTLMGNGYKTGHVYVGQADEDDAKGVAGWEDRTYTLNLKGSDVASDSASAANIYVRTTGSLNISDMTVNHTYVCDYGAINLTNAKLIGSGGVNFYISGRASKKATGKAVVTLNNSVLDHSVYELDLGCQGADNNSGSGLIVLKNGSTLKADSLYMQANADGSLGTIAIQSTDSAIQVTKKLTIGAGDTVTLKNSTVSLASLVNNGTLSIDATGITDPVKVIDYTSTDAMTLADYGTVNVTDGGVAYVEDNDLWVKQANFYADADGVYHIRNLAGLKEFRNQTNAGTLKGENKAGGHLQVVLDADIDLGNEEWTPINMSCIDFDGQNHTVKNLKVTGNAKNVGFFGEATISTVKNLTIDTATVEGINHVAAIAGDGLCGHFINCTVKNATITTKVYNNDDGDKAGAICGYLSGESDAEVTNCTVENCTITGYRDCGGAVGYANGTASVTGTTVKDTTVVNEKSVNYKTYATDAAYNVNQVVGNTTSKATVENNTATNVMVVRPTMVAKIGVNEYDNLSAAIAAANGKEVTVELLCDVDLKGAAWTAATMNHATFDGKGHKVSNFTVTGEKMVGFFGNADCSTIKNLTIENATVNGINHVGAVAGRGMCTYIENCSAVNCTVTTTVKDNDDGDKAGAICGYLSGEPNAWVKGCTVTGCTVTGYRDTGAVVGYADCYPNGTAEVSGCTVTETTVINNRSVNYKNYQTDAEFDVNEVVGEICANAASTVTDNTTTDVTVRRTVAKIGETVYFDLHEAFVAAKANETVELLCNVDLNGAAWEPVNLVSSVTVDGKGYTVSNFTATGEKNVGLFGSASICTIKNLTVRNATVSGINHVAAIAGDGLCAKIENCSVFDSTITTTVKDNDDGDKAGAICGYLSGESTAWVTNCTVEGCTVTGYRDTGAVVGYANGTALVLGVTVTNSVVLCDQSVNYKSYTGDQFDVRAFIGEVVSTATTNSLKATTVSVGVVTDGFMPTTNGVWHITNLNGLKAFRDSVNSGKSYAGMTIQLDADIDLGNEDWTPIVAQNESVVFNGNGKTISNLKVVDEDGKDLGLFSNACGWTVKNLTIDGATVTGIGRVAALVGHGMCAKIENCTVKNATVTANVADNDDGDKAGAICGYLTAQPNAWVKNCAVENCTIRGYRDIGGAVGYAQGNNCQVTDTTVTGTTVINDQMVNYKNYSGTEFDANLIVGQIDGTVSTEGSTATETVVTVIKPVAKIGDTKYASLEDALAAAQDNDTIKMLENETMAYGTSLTLPSKKITLDLNGCTITGSGNAQGQYFYFLSLGTGADLTIDDTSVDASGAIIFTANPYDSGYGVENCTIYNCGGTLTLKNGTVKNLTEGGLTYAINNSSNAWGDPIVSTFTMLGGKVSAPKGDGALRIYQNAYSQVSENYVTISGGEIVDTGIFVDAYSDKNHDNANTKTVVKITGGTIHGLIDAKLRNDKLDFTISGGTFVDSKLWVRQASGSVVSTLTTPVVKVTGGTFTFTDGKAFGLAYDCEASSWDANATPYAVSGGTFSVDPTTWVVKGYQSKTTDSTTWTVTEKDTVIADVKAAQRYPWNGLVDITFSLKTKSAVTLFVAAYDSTNTRIAMTAAKLVTKDANDQTVESDINVADGTFTGAANTEATTYHIVWDSTTVLPNTKKDGVTFKVFAK